MTVTCVGVSSLRASESSWSSAPGPHVLEHGDVLEARHVDDDRRIVRVVSRLLVAGLEEQPVRRSTSEPGARGRRGRAGSAHGQPRATNPLTKKSNNNRDRTAHGFLYLP